MDANNDNNKGLMQRLALSRRALYVAAVAVLGAGLMLSTGMARSLVYAAAGPSAMSASQPPLSDGAVAPLLALDKATEAVTARVTPAVVNITVTDVTPQRGGGMQPGGMQPMQPMQPGDDGSGGGQMQGLPPGFSQFFRQFRGGQPAQPQEMKGLGSGVVVSPDGYIVTNNHVVDGAKTITVTFANQDSYPAKLIGTDKATDLAVVKINATGLTSASWGDSSLLQPGQTVLAFGNPLHMDFTVTRGIVSALNRSRSQGDGPDARGAFIQTDAAINEGNSGGPLVNVRGEVVGIDTEMLTSGGGYAGIGFAIPSNVVQPTAEALIKNGKVVRGYLGVTIIPVTPALAESLGVNGNNGAVIDGVTADSPGARAGLKQYDVVTAVDGKKVVDSNELQAVVGSHAPGSTIQLTVVRDDKPITVAVTLGNLDDANAGNTTAANGGSGGAGVSASRLGIQAAPLTPDMRAQLRLPDGVTGVAVQQVEPASPADNAGIAAGDVIEQVNKKPVTTVQGLQDAVAATAPGKPVLLLVHNSGGDFIMALHPNQ